MIAKNQTTANPKEKKQKAAEEKTIVKSTFRAEAKLNQEMNNNMGRNNAMLFFF